MQHVFLDMYWLYLLLAILLEVIGTTCMKLSEGFTKLWPSVIMFASYACAFTFLTLSLKQIPVGVAYAVWSGLGTAAIVVIGYFFFRQLITWQQWASVALIILGVIGLNLYGKAH